MWGKLLKFPAHPPYKPIRSTHEQRSETGASKRTKISCGSRSGVVRGRQGSSGGVRGRQESSGVVRSRQGSSGVVRSRQESSGVVRGRQGSSGVVRSRQGSSGVVRGRQGSSGVVRGRQESSGVVRSRQGSSGVVRGRQESSGVISDQGRQSRQESSAEIGQLLLPSLYTLIPKNFSPFPGLCFILLPFRGGWFAWLFQTNLGPESLFRVSRQPSCVWAPFWFGGGKPAIFKCPMSGGYFQLVGWLNPINWWWISFSGWWLPSGKRLHNELERSTHAIHG